MEELKKLRAELVSVKKDLDGIRSDTKEIRLLLLDLQKLVVEIVDAATR